MMCANCLEYMSVNTNYYVLKEMFRDVVEGKVKLCSHKCIEEWLQ